MKGAVISVARKLTELLAARERTRLGLLLFLVFISSLLEMVSVASVLPFLSVAADPGQIQANAWLNWVYEGLGFTSANGFLLGLAGGALFALVFSNTWRALTHWAQIRFAFGCCHSLSLRLLRHYLSQSYSFFLQRNSADFSKNILGEIDQIRMVLIAALKLVMKGMAVIAILGALIVYDPLLAIILSLVLGGAYGSIYAFSRKKLQRLGKDRIVANSARFQLASESFSAIKDVKLLGCEGSFLKRFANPSKRFNNNQALSMMIGELPRYALEAIAFGGVLVIAIYLLLIGHRVEETIPVLGFYAFAGYRLMPGLQQAFASYTRMSFGGSAVQNLHRELVSGADALRADAPPLPSISREGRKALPLTKHIELDGISFTYQGTDAPVLEDVTLSIECNSIVGIVGTTGSGKTTLVDIILGLLRPQSGEIRVDGVSITDDKVQAWQNGLGYVPQHICLIDDTITRNIALGVPDEEIDQAAVECAATIANIHDVIVNDLSDGYETMVGERGVRLSGGQRQRIGIARALYHDPNVLVFDEATSALDNNTETAVMEAINKLAGTRTILMIAHRLTTLDACEAILRVQDGRVWTEKKSNDAAAFVVNG